MKSVKFDVTRLYIAFGYFLEYYESVDGARANQGLTEIWVGKDDEPFKEFVIQVNLGDDGYLDKNFIFQNIFAAAIVDYNTKFQVGEQDETTPLEGCGLREVDYEVTRYYLRDDYYFDIDTFNPWEDEELDGVKTIHIGKLNSQTKVSVCDLMIDEEITDEDEEKAYLDILEQVEEQIEDLFEIELRTLDLDMEREEEDVKEYGIYYSLADIEESSAHISEGDEVTF